MWELDLGPYYERRLGADVALCVVAPGREAAVLRLGGAHFGVVRRSDSDLNVEVFDCRDFTTGASVLWIQALDEDHVVVRVARDVLFDDPVDAVILDLGTLESVASCDGRAASEFVAGVTGQLQLDGERWTQRAGELLRHDSEGNIVERYAAPKLEGRLDSLYGMQPLADGRMAYFDSDFVHLWDAFGHALERAPRPRGVRSATRTRVVADPLGRLWFGPKEAPARRSQKVTLGPAGSLPLGRPFVLDPEGTRLWAWGEAEASASAEPKSEVELFELDAAGASVTGSIAVIEIEGGVLDISFEEDGTAWVWLADRALAFGPDGDLLCEVELKGYRPESEPGMRHGAMSLCKQEATGFFGTTDWAVVDLSVPGAPRRVGISDLELTGWDFFALEPTGVLLKERGWSVLESGPLFTRRSIWSRRWRAL